MRAPRLQLPLAAAALWVLAHTAHAEVTDPQIASPQAPATASTVPVAAAIAPTRPVPAEKSWRLGIGVGYGARTNPLILSEDIPILVDIDFGWFGKRWFFDNLDLGFRLADNRVFTLNAVARLNSDRVFFGKTNTRYVNFTLSAKGERLPLPPSTGANPGGPTLQPAPAEPQELKVPDRDYAGELGLEMLFDGEWGQASVHAFHDVTDTHEGFEVSADYSYRWTRGRLSVAPSVGVSYKSDELSNYYWGVTAQEAANTLTAYEAKGGVDWEAGVRASYYLTKSTRIALSANYERLHDSVALSPIVAEDHVLGYFAGLVWQF